MSRVKGAGVQRMEWKMTGFLQQCVDLYKDIAGEKGKRLKGADTPFLSVSVDDMAAVAEGPTRGELAPIASRVLMKILYAARMARYDLLRATCFLAARIAKWNAA